MQQLAPKIRDQRDESTGSTSRPIEFARARRSGHPLTFVMIDLDHFKRYNDRRGHPAGDAVLRGAAQAWLKQLRPTDMLARYGGEEFTLVLPSTDAKQAEQLVNRLRARSPIADLFSRIATWDLYENEPRFAASRAALLQAKRRAAIEPWSPVWSHKSRAVDGGGIVIPVTTVGAGHGNERRLPLPVLCSAIRTRPLG